MKYIIKKAFLHLFANKKNYIMFFLQIIIGIYIFSYVMTSLLNMWSSVNEINKITDENVFVILNDIIDKNDSANIVSFSEENYQHIKEKYKDQIYIALAFNSSVNISFIYRKNIFFINNDFIKLYIDKNYNGSFEEEENAYLEKDIDDFSFSANNYIEKIDNETVTLTTGQTLNRLDTKQLFPRQIKLFLPYMQKYIDIKETKILLNQLIILPISSLDWDKFTQKNIHIKFKGDYDYNTMNEILSYLGNSNKNFNYTIVKPYEIYKELIDFFIEWFYIFLIIGILVLIIITIGLIGILLIFTNRRMKEIAIVIACGAKLKDIYLEFFISTFIVMGTGSLIGGILGGFSAVLANSETREYVTHFRPDAIILCILVSLLICFLGVITPIIKVRKLKTIEILQKQ